MSAASAVRAELDALSSLHGWSVPPLPELSPHLSRYAELVLAEQGVEIITGGVGDARALAAIGERHGASRATCTAFLAVARDFPHAMLGLKLCFGPGAATPTLYVRLLAPRAVVLRSLAEAMGEAALPQLAEAVETHAVLYGLGFFDRGGEAGVKVYAVDEVALADGPARPGFVSWRVLGGVLTTEIKRYVPDVAWDELPRASPTWAALIDGVRARLGGERVGHWGVVERVGEPPEIKLYFERIGAIPSDFTAR